MVQITPIFRELNTMLYLFANLCDYTKNGLPDD